MFKSQSDTGRVREWREWSKRWRDEARSHERGFSMVETVVAIGVFTITLIPTTSVFWGGLQASSVSSIRSDAVGVAASTLATVQALPYNEVGFFSSQIGYVAACPSSVSACSGAPTVNAQATGGISPVTTQKVGATTFTITTYITWANATVPSGTTCGSNGSVTTGCWAQAYPQVTAVVTWRGPTAGSITESTIYYPGGQGKWTAPGTLATTPTCTATPTQPGSVAAAAIDDPTMSSAAVVNVTWQAASEPCYYVIDVATQPSGLPSSCTVPSGNGFQANYWQASTAENYYVTGLTWGQTYYFAVVAYSAGGASCQISSESPPVDVVLPPSSTGSTCTVSSFSVTAVPSNSTSKTYEDTHGNMTDNLNLVASTTGTCSNITVVSELNTTSTQDPGSPYALTTSGSSGQYTFTVNSIGTAWTTGQHEFTVDVNGSGTNEQQSMEVCAHAGSGQKTNNGNACP